jgi:uncharacterized protein (DUF885 family)
MIFSFSCSQESNHQFENLTNNYLEVFLQTNPEWATQLGDHRYDNQVYDYSESAIFTERDNAILYLDSLEKINTDKLSKNNHIDYQILKSHLQYTIFAIDTLQEHTWNPRAYNVGYGIYGLIARDFAPLDERLKSVKARLEKIPSILAQAKIQLNNPPKIHIETAILQNKGNISLINNDLEQFLDNKPLLREEIKDVRSIAITALEDYGKWLEEDLLPKSDGNFRLGDDKWRRKLYYTVGSDFTKEQILESAEKDLKLTQNVMYATASPLYEKFFNKKASNNKSEVIKAVLDKLAEDRPTNKTIVELAEQTLASTTAFVRANDLVTVPDEPVQIIVMPEFQRGVAVAYCDSPGPLEKSAETFYSISPTPKDWSAERTESFFKEYNNYMLKDLTVHEAMPGHYLQLAHSNRFKAPTLIRSIFYSGTFVEGWATYAEQLMVEFGYGGNELKMQQLKMRLRLLINSIIDQKIHTAGMTEEEALQLMMNEGFQEEGEAVGKWRRACMSSTQLSTYYVGNMEINDIRRAYEAKHGRDIDIKSMHDQILSFGSPPPKYIKQLLEL